MSTFLAELLFIEVHLLKTNKTKLCGLRSTRQGLEEGREQVEWRGVGCI